MTPPSHIYKIFQISEWEGFQDAGVFKGSPVDLKDGFIHLSCAGQMQGTLDKHYTEAADLVVAKIKAAQLGSALKYEASRGGEDFPHLYSNLLAAAVSQTWPISPDENGRYNIAAIIS